MLPSFAALVCVLTERPCFIRRLFRENFTPGMNQRQVDSGYISLEPSGEKFEFLSGKFLHPCTFGSSCLRWEPLRRPFRATGTWGGILPAEAMPIVKVEPFDGCNVVENFGALRGAIALVKRGLCGFGDKAVNIQVGLESAIVIFLLAS